MWHLTQAIQHPKIPVGKAQGQEPSGETVWAILQGGVWYVMNSTSERLLGP